MSTLWAAVHHVEEIVQERAMRNYHYILWTKFYELVFRKKAKGENIIYMFHSIYGGETNPKEFKTNKKSFELFLQKELKKRRVSSMSQIIEKKSKMSFAITFDDVFENVYTNAYPILKRYRVPFTLFVSTGLLDQPGYLTSSQLLELSRDGLCTVGAHTVNHVRLRTDKQSYQEIVDSKKELEDMIGRKIEFFAYPYGSIFACSRKNIKQVEKAGFSAAFSTMTGFIPLKFDKYRFFLPRNNGDHFVKYMEEKSS